MNSSFHSLFPFLFLFLLILANKSSPLPYVDLSEQVAEYALFESELISLHSRLVLFEVQLKEDLYITEFVGCFPRCVPPPDPGQWPCDYTKCSQVQPAQKLERKSFQYFYLNSSSSSPSPSPSPRSENKSSCDMKLCSLLRNYRVLEASESVHNLTIHKGILSDHDVDYFMFYFDKPCHAMILNWEYYGGGYRMYWSNSPLIPQFDKTTGWALYHIHRSRTLCPRSPYYRYGTYYVAVIRTDKVASYGLSLNVIDLGTREPEVRPKPVGTTASATCGGSPAYPCLQDGVVYGPVTPGKLGNIYASFFSFRVFQCTALYISIEIINNPDVRASLSTPEFSAELSEVPYTDTYSILSKARWSYSHNRAIHVCPRNMTSSLSSFMDIYILIGSIGEYQYLVSVATAPPEGTRAARVRLSDQSTFHMFNAFTSMSELTCPSFVHICRFPAYNLEGTICRAYRPLFPSRIPQPFWPPLQDLQTAYFPYFAEPQMEFKASVLQSSLIMRSSSRGAEWIWFNETELTSCQMSFVNFAMLTTKDGKLFLGNLKLKEKQHICNQQDFDNLLNNFDNYLALIQSDQDINNNNLLLISNRMNIDALTFSEAWQYCKEQVDQMLQPQNFTLTVNNTKKCFLNPTTQTKQFMADPCCNVVSQWTQCCAERNISITLTDYIGDPTLEKVSQCSQSDQCIQNVFNDYSSQKIFFEHEKQCSDLFVIVEEELYRELEFYRQCRQKFFGEYERGIPCFSDLQCFGGECDHSSHLCVTDWHILSDLQCFGGECDHSSHLCVTDWHILSDLFFQCLENNTNLALELQIKKLLLKRYQLTSIRNITTEDCLSEDGRFSTSHSHFSRAAKATNCIDCPQSECYDKSCQYPVRCLFGYFGAQKGSLCSLNWIYETSYESSCLSVARCNWDPTLNKSACLNGSGASLSPSPSPASNSSETKGFCGYCVSAHNCLVFPNVTAKSCNGIVCIKGNGQYVFSADGNCDVFGYCSINCTDGKCHQSLAACESRSVCQDPESLFELDGKSISGFCTTPMSPFDMNPDCSNDKDFFTGSTVFSSIQGCVRPDVSRGNCTGSATWLDNPNFELSTSNKTVEERCAQFREGCREPDLLVPELYTFKSSSECKRCGGDYRRSSTITKGQWVKSKKVAMKWYQAEYSSVSRWSTNAVNFNQLYALFEEAAVEKVKARVLSQLQCSYNPLRKMMDNILCLCSSNKTANCTSTSDLMVGDAIVIPDIDEAFNLPPTTINVFKDSLRSSEPAHIEVLLLTEGRYIQPSNDVRLSTSFVSNKQGHIPGGFVSVVNKYQLNIGQLLGDGVRISSTQNLRNIQICIRLRLEATQIYQQFTTLDMGSSDGAVVRPLRVPVWRQERYLCSKIETISSGVSISLFPIARVEDADSTVASSLTQTEKGLFYFIAISFSICAILSLSELVFHFRFGWLRHLLILFASLIRAIYFFLLASGVFESNSENTLDYVLIEIPTFFFISLTLDYTLSFILSLRSALRQSLFYTITFIMNLIIYIIFIVIIILFAVIHDDPASVQTCGSTASSTKFESPNHVRIIRIVYRVVVTVLSFGVGISLIIAGSRVKIIFDRKRMTNQVVTKKIEHLFFLSTLIGGSLFFNSLAFLIYFVVDQPSPWFVLVLFFTELAPWVVVYLQRLFMDEITTRSKTNSSSSSNLGTV